MRVIEVSMEQSRNERARRRRRKEGHAHISAAPEMVHDKWPPLLSPLRRHEYLEKTRQQAASSSTIPTCNNPGVNLSDIEPRSPCAEESWAALNIEVLRAEVIIEQHRNARARETGDPRENPSTSGIARHDSHVLKSGAAPPGIEPSSPRWEAGSLTTSSTAAPCYLIPATIVPRGIESGGRWPPPNICLPKTTKDAFDSDLSGTRALRCCSVACTAAERSTTRQSSKKRSTFHLIVSPGQAGFVYELRLMQPGVLRVARWRHKAGKHTEAKWRSGSIDALTCGLATRSCGNGIVSDWLLRVAKDFLPSGYAAGWRVSYEALIGECRRMASAGKQTARSRTPSHPRHGGVMYLAPGPRARLSCRMGPHAAGLSRRLLPTHSSRRRVEQRRVHRLSRSTTSRTRLRRLCGSERGGEGGRDFSPPLSLRDTGLNEARIEQRWNARARETVDPRVNPPTSGIIQHDSHLRKSGSEHESDALNRQQPTANMDAIKKKMQAMKLEKDNAMDRALLCEQQARDANLRAEKRVAPPFDLMVLDGVAAHRPLWPSIELAIDLLRCGLSIQRYKPNYLMATPVMYGAYNLSVVATAAVVLPGSINSRYTLDTAEEEARSLQKKIQTIENELDQTQESLGQVNAKLEEKDKALQTNWRPGARFSSILPLVREPNYVSIANQVKRSLRCSDRQATSTLRAIATPAHPISGKVNENRTPGSILTMEEGLGKESAMVVVRDPCQHSPRVISESHGKPKSEWPHREIDIDQKGLPVVPAGQLCGSEVKLIPHAPTTRLATETCVSQFPLQHCYMFLRNYVTTDFYTVRLYRPFT
ncbi:hypothetical protein PR048_015858, partial [Dryococelus australis]